MQLYKNNGQSTLASNVAPTDTSLFIQPGHGGRFPTITGVDYFYLTLENASGSIEIIKVTAHTANSTSMTVIRAQQGTGAIAWLGGDLVELRSTSAEMAAFESDIDALESTRSKVAGDIYSGVHDYRSAALKVATQTAGDSSNSPASTAFVANMAFLTSLPGQAGNAGKILSTDGSTATWIQKEAKEDVIPTGTNSQYWRGDKTWTELAADVRGAVLTGLSTVSAAAVLATDSVLIALGKLQKQISDAASALTNHVSSTGNVHGLTPANIGLGNVDNTADSSKSVNLAANISGIAAVVNGGTGANSAVNARANLGVPALSGANFTGAISAPTVTQTSDERLKENWTPLPCDLLRKFAEIERIGFYDLIDGNAPSVGIGAQSLEEVCDRFVITDETGQKSVNYGVAALMLCKALSDEIILLRKELRK